MIYCFNTETGEFSMSMPFETELSEGRTTIAPPEFSDGERPVFDGEKWEIKKDYRFTHKLFKKDGRKNIIIDIEELGSDFPKDYNLITIEQAEIYKKENHINALHMTKQDFYNHVLKPNGITYDILLNVLKENIDLQAAWDLCKDVYRGDDFLNKYIKNYIPGITDSALNELFEQYGEYTENDNSAD